MPTNSMRMLELSMPIICRQIQRKCRNIYANYLATNLKNMSDFLCKVFADKSKENITIFNANYLPTNSNKYRNLLC